LLTGPPESTPGVQNSLTFLPHHFDAQEPALAGPKQSSRPRTKDCLRILDLLAVNPHSALLDQAVRGRSAFHQASLFEQPCERNRRFVDLFDSHRNVGRRLPLLAAAAG